MWEIIERSGAVKLLENSLKREKLANAYLISGPEHVGKMTLALDIARAVNCTGTKVPCGECSSCRKIAGGKHADVRVFDLNIAKEIAREEDGRKHVKEIGVEVITAILRLASLPPYEGKYRVFIIDEAELLSTAAANRLLKTLEEPEEKVIFILLTIAESMILPTVVSRCQKIELRPLPVSDVKKYLLKTGVEADRARVLAHLSRGRLGWAIRAAFDGAVLEERQEKLDNIISLITSDIRSRFEYAAHLSAQFSEDRRPVFEEMELWIEWWRDILLVKTDNRDQVINIDRLSTISELAKEYSLSQIRSFIFNLQEAVEHLKINASARMVLDVLMLNIPGRKAL